QRDGASFSKNVSTTVVMDANHTLKAVYDTANTRRLSIKSSNPNSAVAITVTPSDVSGISSGNSAFQANFNAGADVRVRAPSTAGGNVFKKWLLDGYQWDIAASTLVNLDSDHELTAVYEPASTVNVTVQTNPSGVNIIVDGTTYSSTQTFSWAPNSNHTIAAD